MLLISKLIHFSLVRVFEKLFLELFKLDHSGLVLVKSHEEGVELGVGSLHSQSGGESSDF